MNKDVKTGMLIGLVLVIAAVIAVSIWPGGRVQERLMQDDGNKGDELPTESVNRGTPPHESNSDRRTTAVQKEMQRVAAHVIEELEPATIDAGPRIHVVADGETLTHIAQLHYGDVNKVELIADANKNILPNVNRIRPGMRLRIPPPDN